MKISPLPAGGTPGTDLSPQQGPSKLERAKAAMQGVSLTQSDTPISEQAQLAQRPPKRITMRTQVSPDRAIEQAVAETPVEAVPPATSDISDPQPVVEDTKPLSPQFAALARQRRALQAKEREIADRERALESKATSSADPDLIARLKSQPLSVLQEHGVTYDQLTEAILSGQAGNPEIAALKAEIKALKEGVDNTLSQRDQQQEQQVLSEIRKESQRLAAQGESFEMVRETGSYEDVVSLIHRTYKETGEILDTTEAMQLVEDELIKDAIKLANTSKLKSRLAPAAPSQQQPPSPQLKTLTNRDTARPVMDRRSRAIAAALGQLKR
jgi:hypothetical protein